VLLLYGKISYDKRDAEVRALASVLLLYGKISYDKRDAEVRALAWEGYMVKNEKAQKS